MTVECSICKSKIGEGLLGKIDGTYVKKKNDSKLYPVCKECQKAYGDGIKEKVQGL